MRSIRVSGTRRDRDLETRLVLDTRIDRALSFVRVANSWPLAESYPDPLPNTKKRSDGNDQSGHNRVQSSQSAKLDPTLNREFGPKELAFSFNTMANDDNKSNSARTKPRLSKSEANQSPAAIRLSSTLRITEYGELIFHRKPRHAVLRVHPMVIRKFGKSRMIAFVAFH